MRDSLGCEARRAARSSSPIGGARRGLQIAFRDHVVEHLEHAAGAAVEREVRQRQVTRSAAVSPLD